ncbi:hypothetical protein PR048_010175 [Dryococelus australis]|uniref:Uncharacterized protein n=1 Tax=Dryococelus australis TaxID=614101 RepID=A0ABQ9I209_9NEOP|nr:hypothetical protein PR048_010175 [Dryococelus australis]
MLKELEDIVKSTQVIPMVTDDFIDYALLATQYINTQNLGISKASHIKVTKNKPFIVKILNTFAFEEPSWTKTDVLKNLINLGSLPAVE